MERFRVYDTCSSGTSWFSFEGNGIKFMLYLVRFLVLQTNTVWGHGYSYLYGVSATRLRTGFQLQLDICMTFSTFSFSTKRHSWPFFV